jgi:hypothetical protein
MIQRIQTLFLLGAAIFMSLMLFIPIAEFTLSDGRVFTAQSSGLVDEQGELAVRTTPVIILIIVTAALLLLNVFLYKRRKLQIRFCVYAIILEFGLIGLMYYFWVVIVRQLEMGDVWIKLPAVFPVVAIILTYLAFRGIRRDEILIRSMDKLR